MTRGYHRVRDGSWPAASPHGEEVLAGHRVVINGTKMARVVRGVAAVPQHEVVPGSDGEPEHVLPDSELRKNVGLFQHRSVDEEPATADLDLLPGQANHALDELDRRVSWIPERDDVSSLDATGSALQDDQLSVTDRRQHR